MRWLEMFKTRLDRTALDRTREELRTTWRADYDFQIGRTREGVFVLRKEPALESDYFPWLTTERCFLLSRWYFEELAAISTAHLHRHLACVKREGHSRCACHASFEFQCPAGAAIAQARLYGGTNAEVDGWFRRSRRTACLAEIAFLPVIATKTATTLAPEGAEFVVRAMARAILADALEAFIKAAPERAGRWAPNFDKCLPVTWTLDRDTLRVACAADAPWLAALAKECDRLCLHLNGEACRHSRCPRADDIHGRVAELP
jgi:hypothetical protein